MERSTLDLWVGLFVVAGLGALTILALKVGNMGSLSAALKPTSCPRSSPISAGSNRAPPVKSAGVVVGRVSTITLR